MSVNGINGSGAMANMFRRLRAAGGSASNASGAADGTTPSSDASAAGQAAGPRRGDFANRLTSALQDQGITGDTLASLQQKIQSTVQQVRSSNGSRDDVRSAVDGVLKDAGVDLDKLHEEMKPPAGGNGGPHSAGRRGGSIAGMLSQAGIDPEQFKSKLMSMLQSGNVDAQSLFQDAQPGSSVDLVA